MPLNIERNKSSDFTDKEKLEVQEMILNHRISEVVKELMKLSNIDTKAQLAKELGVSGAYISKVLSSDKYFNVPFLVKLQNFFETTFTFSAKKIEEKSISEITDDFYKPNEAKIINLNAYTISSGVYSKELEEQYN
jgi:transcriptional regulator with XRE-family HTH domain